MTLKRDMFLVTQATVEKIVTRFGYEKLGEFTFLLSQYCIYWDNHGTGEGFNFSQYSEAVLIYFDTIRDEIDEKHRQFVAQGEQMAKLAKERWEKEQQEDRRREQKRQWYVHNKEKVNSKRRQKASSNVSSGRTEMSSGVSSDVPQSEDDKGVAQNDAARIMNYELMNHKNFKKNYDKGDSEFVDKSSVEVGGNHYPSSGLTGHNLADGSVIRGNHKNGEHKKHKKRKNREHRPQKPELPNIAHNSPQPCGQLPQGEQKLGKDVVQPAPLRPTIYGDTWIRIGDDFEVDLFDPEFECFSRATKFLIRGFETWCRKKLIGQRHDKWWLKDQLGRNFANRQGSISYMVGAESGGNAYVSGSKR